MTDCIPHHELKRQQREYRLRLHSASVESRLRNLIHVRNGKMVLGEEQQDGTVNQIRGLSFKHRALISFFNQSKVLGSIWSTFK